MRPITTHGRSRLTSWTAGIAAATLLVPAAVFAQSPAAAGAPPAPFDAPPVKIALVRQLSSGDFFEQLLAGAQAQASELGIDLLVSSADGDNAKNAENLQTAITQQPAAIIIDHGETDSLKPGIDAAVLAGIPVVAFDANANNPAVPQIEQSDADIARLGLEQLVADTGGTGNIAYVYVAGFAPLDRRDAVFQEVLAANPGLKNVATFGTVSDSTAAEVQTQAAAVLLAHPDIKAIFAPYDEFAKGAVLAVEAAGLQDQVKVYGADISAADIAVITADKSPWVATVGTDPANVGRVAVRAAALAAAGQKVPASIIVPPALITQQALKDGGITTIAQLGAAIPELTTPDLLPIRGRSRLSDLRSVTDVTMDAEAVVASASDAAAIEIVGLRKRYGATIAVAGIDLSLGRGEVHGLVGANGAGKSTFIRMLSGAVRPDAGVFRVDGRAMPLGDPALSHRAGIQAVYQEIGAGILPGHTVAENLAIDRLGDASTGTRYRRDVARRAAATIAAALDLELDLDAPIEHMGTSDRQQILICRALARRPRLLILDEPTSALSEREAERLFRSVRALALRGVTVLYISHRLAEVADLAQRVSVLRDGRLVRTLEPPFSAAVIGQAMLGHLPTTGVTASVSPGDPVIVINGFRQRPDRPVLELTVHANEVVGVFGLVGAGKTGLLEGLFGARHVAGADITLDGRPYRPRDPATAVLRGIHLVPEERSAQAIIGSWSVAANVTLPFLKDIERFRFLDDGRERQRGATAIARMGVVASGPDAPVGTLSGGNQQKVVVARWLVDSARVLLFDEPFRGIDLGARADISAAIREAAQGRAVIVASTDIDELLDVADRIVVLHAGSIVHDGPAAATTRERYAALAAEAVTDAGAAA